MSRKACHALASSCVERRKPGDFRRGQNQGATGGVGQVVVAARGVVDRVAAAAGGPPLQGGELRREPRVVEQVEAAAVDERQQVRYRSDLDFSDAS
jgi:hypothetical protein